MKKLLFIILTLIALMLITLSASFLYFTSPVSKESKLQLFIIKNGESSKTVSSRLKQNNLIRNESIMYLYLRIQDKRIVAGTYELSPDMKLSKIIDMLTTGKVSNSNIIITIPEGKNMRQFASIVSLKMNHSVTSILDAVNDKNYISSKIAEYPWLTNDILNSNIYYPLEGYLFPDTYAIKSVDSSIYELTDKMLAKMDQVITKELKNYQGHYSYHQLITMASIIELEGLNKESRQTVASVFYNRLKINMPLGSDVTTYYAAKVNLNERDLKKSEIKAANPYNTRGPNMAGVLPVGPIAAPSLSAIHAAIYPANTDYLYFVADKYSKMYYTKSYTEHNAIVAKLKREGLWYTWD